jgi:hypothetical protein
MPHLQRLRLNGGKVDVLPVSAWASFRSLNEIYLDDVDRAEARLLPSLNSFPALRLLRWRCVNPSDDYCDYTPVVLSFDLPSPDTLRSLLAAMPQLRVELMVPVEETNPALDEQLTDYQRRICDELPPLPSPPQQPRVRIVEFEAEEDE